MSIRKRLSDAIRPVLEGLERRNLFAIPVADPGGPYTINEGTTQVITGAASTGGSLTYQWDLNYDGVTFHPLLSGSSFSFKPSDGNAVRHMALKVTNVDGTSTTAFDVTISNVAPTINVSGSGTGTEGNPYAITWTKSDPGSDTITSWRVNWGDGSGVEVLAANATGASHSFATADDYTIVVSAVDEDGTHAAANHDITITHILPIVTATGNSTVNEGSDYTLNFSATDAGGTAVALWAIDWGDGSSDVFDGSASSATHAFDDNGSYTVTATAVSEDGDSGTDTVGVTVHNVAPTPTISGAPGGSIAEGTAVNLTGTRTDPGASDTVSYAWAVTKNGSAFDSDTGSSFSFTPDDNGVYVATLTATDNDGGHASVSTSTITVTNANPVPSIAGAPGGNINEGTAVNLTASATDAGSADTRTYAWTVTKNGNAFDSDTGSSFSFTPNDNGTYIVTLTATDDDGGTGTDTETVTVDNVAPASAAISGAPANSDEGTAITLGGTATDVGTADTIVYTWAITKGGNAYTTGSGASFAFTPNDNGAYVVTLTATDDDGDTDTDTANITVDNVAPHGVSITGLPGSSPEGTALTVTAHAADVGSADTISYAWAVTKDGNVYDTDSGSTYSFTPDDNGTYIVTLTATDDDGDDLSVSNTVTVTNVAPTPTITGTPGGSIGEGTAVNLSASSSDPGSNDTFSYAWSVTKNGNAFDSDTGTNFSFTPTDNGAYVVTLTSTDNDGGHSSVSSSTITVTNVNPAASIGGAPGGNVNEGSAVNLSASATDAGTADTHSYAWLVTRNGDEFDTGTGANFSFTPDDNGTYVVVLTATDDDGGTDTDSINVVADNVAPTSAAISGAPANSNEGTAITLTGSASDAGSADSLTYTWAITKDGNAYTTGSGSSFSFTPTDNGAYVVTLTATDDDGDDDTDTANITVDNVAPHAVTITGAPTSSPEGTAINLTGSASDAGSADSLSYAWSVTKDGNAFDTDSGSSYSFTPDDNGTYIVTLTATDDDGDDTSTTSTITVTNANPTPTITGTPGGNIAEGTAVNLTGSATDAGAGDTFSYAWAVTKNGNAFDSGTGANYSFTPTDNGAYVATLTVTDNDGGHASTTTGTITVTNAAPTASIGGAPGGNVNEGAAVNLTASASDPGAADTHSYGWTVTKNGNAFVTGTGGNFSFTPDDNGTYVVTVTATDDDGATDTDSVNVTVDNVAPTGAAISNAPVNSNEGTGITLSGSATDAGTADEITYTWTVTKDGNAFVTGTGSGFTFTPSDNGSYVVTLTATDDDGDTDTDTANITVDNVAPNNVEIAGSPNSSPEGTQISLTGSAGDAGSADTISYDWSVTKNGNAFDTGSGANFNFTPDDNGSYIVTLTATDDDGDDATSTSTISVSNVVPVPTITGTPGGSVAEGTAINLTGSATDVGANDTFSYAWAVTKNGNAFTTGTGTNFSFTPTDNGAYVATLTVTDNDSGEASTTTGTITVTNVNPTVAIGGAPGGSIDEGTAVNLSATPTDAGSADTHSYAWSVTRNGDAFTTGTGANFSFTPDDNGSYVVTVTATDDDGGTGTDTATVTVDNVAPTSAAITGAPGSSNEGTAISLSGSASDVGTGDTIAYTWSVTKNGNAYTTGSGANFAFTPTDNGAYEVTMTATDDDGGTDTDVANITVDNVAPTNVAITGAPTSSPEGTQINLTASSEDAGSADTTTYAWSVTKDGNAFDTGAGASYSVTPDDNGIYIVTLTATDDDGDDASTTSTITVTNANPTPTITGAPGGSIGEGTAVNLSASSTDAGANDTVSYAWVVTKNGNAFDNGTGTNYSFTPNDNGSYIVTLTATDNDGGHASTASTIAVTNVDPVASIGGTPGANVNEGAAVNLTASATDAGTADTHSFEWSVTKNGEAFDNGIGTNYSFTPDDNGTYVVTLTATDDDGGTDTDTTTVLVDNVAPTGATISGAPANANEGDDINVTASASDAGSADTIAYAWSVTRNGNAYLTGSGSSFSFTPNDNGTYVITLTATDDDGDDDTDTASITVDNVAPTDAAISGAPSSSPEGTQISMTADAEDAGSADTIAYSWSVTRNGNAFTTSNGATFNLTPDDNGTYVVTVTATDDDGGTDTDVKTISVTNVNPVPTITGTPGTITEGTAVTLGASATDVGANDTFSYAWAVTKNGNAFDSGAGASYSFTPTDNGSYVVTLTATDNDGGHASTTSTIAVTNVAPVASIGGAPGGHVNEGAAVNLTASATDAGTADTHSFAWSVTKNGDAFSSGSGTNFSFTPNDNGTYVVTLTATDDDEATDTDTVTVTVDNVAPNGATITGAPNTAIEGDDITLGGSASDDAAADTLTYAWSITKNGNAYITGAGESFVFTPNDNGTYVVTLTATDDDGGTDTDTASITVSNFAPLVGITGAPTTSPEGTAVSLGSEVIDASTVDTFSYAWSVTKNGNAYGAAGSSDSYSFTPNDNGTYIVTLTVTDDDGGETTDTRTITVTNVNPTGSIGNAPSSAVDEGTGLSFTSTFSDVGSGDTISSYLWSVTKDGEAFTVANATSANFSFTPTDNGTYVVYLTGTDDDGGVANLSTDAILVNNAAPDVSISGEPNGSIAEGNNISLTGAASDAGALDTLTYQWTVTRDGQAYQLSGSTTTLNLSFLPSDNGTYVATLKVTDKDGTFTTATSDEIVVTNAAPSASVTGEPQSDPNEGSPITLGVSASDPAADDTLSYLWSVTRNGDAYLLVGETSLTGATFTFTPANDGTYVVTVRVTDSDGAFVDADSDSISVINVAPVATLSGDETGTEGSEVTLTAAGTDVGSDVLSFAWTVTRGEIVVASGTGEDITFVPDDNGTYVVTMTALDGDGGTDETTASVVVTNINPVGAIEGSLTGHTEGSLIELTAGGTDVSSADLDAELELAWTITKDGDSFTEGTGSAIAFTPDDNGTYVISLITTDKDGGTHTTSSTITVANVDPEAEITGTPESSSEGSEISLGSSVVDAGNLDAFTYLWSVTRDDVTYVLGDDVETDGEAFSFTPADDGVYVVTLLVTDNDGGTVTATTTEMVVDNENPTATLEGPEELLRGTVAHFTGDWADVGINDTQTITWSFGDGATQVFSGSSASATEISHTYNTPGEYTVTYTVTDKDGGSVTAEHVIVVSAAMVSVDPSNSSKTALFINGSNGTDNIVLRPGDGGQIEVLINGESQGFFTITGGIYINAYGGDDSISISAAITTGAVIDAGSGNDTVSGGAGNDTVTAGAGDDEVRGGAGNDIINGNSGADRIIGGDGNDDVDGGTENDIIYGQNGADSLNGGAGKDRIYGADGDDAIDGDEGDDSLFGENGKDRILGDLGNDSLDGGNGADNVQGGVGDDQLTGGAGADKLYGQAGNDSLTGGADGDRLDGGEGTDVALKDAADSYPNTESVVSVIKKPKPSKKTTVASQIIKK